MSTFFFNYGKFVKPVKERRTPGCPVASFSSHKHRARSASWSCTDIPTPGTLLTPQMSHISAKNSECVHAMFSHSPLLSLFRYAVNKLVNS